MVDPSLDKALEAVCLKAMATKPADRYASGRALAEDVERWMADEPVTAYPEPWVRTLARWLTRHRTGVTGVAAALLAGVVGLSAVLAVQTRANAALEDERAKAEKRFELAQKAIATFHTDVSEDMLLKNAEFKELRTKLLKKAAGFYDDLKNLLERQTDAKSRKALAAAYFQLAGLTGNIGSIPEALAMHRKVLAIRRELAAVGGADVETRLNVARSLLLLGSLLHRSGDTKEALSALREQRDLVAALEAESPTYAVRAQAADGHLRLGDIESRESPALALESYRKALAISQKLPETGQYDLPGQALTSTLESQAIISLNMGWVLLQTGKLADALESFRTASGIAEKLAKANPANMSVQQTSGPVLSRHRPRAQEDREADGSSGSARQGAGDHAEADRCRTRGRPVPNVLGRELQQHRSCAVAVGQAVRRLGSAIEGFGDPPEAGGCQSRRRRVSERLMVVPRPDPRSAHAGR